jgi:C-22 sterol desaturase
MIKVTRNVESMGRFIQLTPSLVMYIKRKGPIAGPPFKIPLMGPFLQALHPNFEAYLAQWASGPLSCVSVFHKYVLASIVMSSELNKPVPKPCSHLHCRFVVLASDRDLAHKVFKSPSYAEPCIVPLAKDIIGHKAWVFLQGKAHAEYRRGLTPLFTNKAMATYLPVQEKVLADYFDKFVAASKVNQGRPMAFMTMFREINCALSCRTFFGDYISQDAVKRIADDFYLVTAALELVNVPLSMYIPFTKPWLGKRTADAVHVEFAKCAAACKANMMNGATPTCIVDHWVLHMMESKRYLERIAAGETDLEKPTNLIREFTNAEIGETLFTFLFASQDASSSATTWLFQVLAQRPDVVSRLREENLAARGGDTSKRFDLPMLESLVYTNAVIKELLRHRPPVIFVPYLATKNFPVTPNYTVPKGSMIIPSCYPALHDPDVYPNPDVFDPERWMSGDAESKTKNWLVFGAGPHDCLARRYVPLSMAGMIGKAVLELDWSHHATERSEEIRVFATLFPMVSSCY